MAKIVECIPNFSEGRRPEVIEAILGAIRSTPGVDLLDHSSDTSHNRTVVTFVGAPEAVVEGAFNGIREATKLIDLNQHKGEHPRMGASDVVPFVPVSEVNMKECVELAHRLAKRVAEELEIPVYLYEHAATTPLRRNLADVRKGEYEGLKEAVKLPERCPDYGAPCLHPTAGAVAIGARQPLVAFNVNLNTSDLSIAKKIAKAIRGSSGGFVNVKALGVMLEERQVAQVTMNMVDFKATPLHRALEFIRREAERYGVMVTDSEIVGMVPVDALLDAASYYLQLEGFKPAQILEKRLYQF